MSYTMKSAQMQAKHTDYLLFSLVLPLLAGLALFSSKERFPDYQLTQLFSWSLLFVYGSIFIRVYKDKKLAELIVLTTIIFRCFSYVLPEVALFDYLSKFIFAILIALSGACLLLTIPGLLLKQMYWLSIISVIMSLLQINGVLWAQEFGSAIDWKIASDVPVLFTRYSAINWIGLTQMRPDGLTHANNLTSQFLLFFYSYAFFFYVFKNNFRKYSMKSLFIISFASALNGGKIILLVIFSIYAVVLIFFLRNNGRRLLRAFAITLAGYLLAFILFPGVFELNFNINLFLTNMIGRIINLSNAANLPILFDLATYLTRFTTYQYKDFELTGLDLMASYSGLSWLVLNYSGVYILLIILYLFWRRNLWKVNLLYFENIRIFMSLFWVVIIASIFGGPFIITVWFALFLSFILIPITLPLMTNNFIQSVSHGVDLNTRRC